MLFQNPTVKNSNHDNPEDFRCGFETLVQKQSDVEKDMLCWTIILYLCIDKHHMSQLLLLGKFEYGGGPIFKVVLEC